MASNSDSNTTSPLMQTALDAAFAHADKKFHRHLSKQWVALGNKDVKRELAEDNDDPQGGFSRRHLLNSLEKSRERLRHHLQSATDADSFFAALQSYVDEQVDELFFVHNNRAEAHILRDYFDMVMISMAGAMEGAGTLPAEEARGLIAVFEEYYGIQLESYDCLRELVYDASSGTTSSMVGYALADHFNDHNKKGLSALPALKDRSLEGANMVRDLTKRSYNNLLADYYGMEYDPEQHLHPSCPWLFHHSRDLAAIYYEKNLTAGAPTVDRNKINKESAQVERGLLVKVNELLGEHGDVVGAIQVSTMFDDMRAVVSQLPVGFDDMVSEALAQAKVTMKENFTKTWKRADAHRALQPQPASHAIGQGLWPHMESHEHDAMIAEEIADYFNNVLKKPASMERLVKRAQVLVDETANTVFFTNIGPAIFPAMADYLQALRRTLAAQMLEAGSFDPAVFAPLKRLEDRCHHYHESFSVLRQWTMEHTHNQFDRMIYPEYLRFASENPIPLGYLGEKFWDGHMKPRMQKAYGELLRDRGLNRPGFEHPLLPFIAKKAHVAAKAECGDAPDMSADPQRVADYYTQLGARTKEVLNEALDRLPQRDPLDNRKHKNQPFAPDAVDTIVTHLDRQAIMHAPRGRA